MKVPWTILPEIEREPPRAFKIDFPAPSGNRPIFYFAMVRLVLGLAFTNLTGAVPVSSLNAASR